MNRNHVVQVSIKVLDQATDPLKRISDQTKKISSGLNGVGTSLGAFSNKMGAMAKSLDGVANSLYKFNMYTSSIQRNLKLMGTLGAVAGVGLAVQSTNRAIDFEYKTTKMQTKMETTGAVRKDIADYILNDLNPRVSFSPSEIADLAIVFGQGGISNKEDMKNLLGSTTYFSEAVDTDPSNAGQMLISALKGFDLPMEKAGEVTDKLTVALNNSLLEADELPHSLGQLAGRAKMLGQSLDSSLVSLMVAKDQGMESAQAAQNLLFGLRQLSQAGNEDFAQPRRMKYYEKGGIDLSFFDMEKRQIKEYPEIIESLEKSLLNLGWMPNKEHLYEVVDKNQGRIPDGLIDKMMAMPMISRVFGAAGQTPLVMGLQARYEEIDKETGESTGNIYYGSDALKKMREELANSTGAVEKVHQEMSLTAKYQLDVLSGVWQAAQIKITDDFLPIVKQATSELTSYISGKGTSGALDRLDESIASVSENLRNTSPELADFVQTVGSLATSAVRVGQTVPATFEQIGKSMKDNLIDTDWGDSLLTLPYYATKNGIGFIQDTLSKNPKFDEQLANLPPELQDSAKLTRGLIQGGVVLVAAGAIVKIIELAFRSASALIKGGKMGLDLGKWLIDMMSGKPGGKGVGDVLSNMTVTANIVNVYGANSKGTTVTSTPAGSGKEKPLPPRSETHGKGGSGGGTGGKIATGVAVLTGAAMVGEMAEAANDYFGINGIEQTGRWDLFGATIFDLNKKKPGNPAKYSEFLNNNGLGSMDILGPHLSESNSEIRNALATLSIDNKTALTEGFNNIRGYLDNIRIENNITLNPNINISGDLKNSLTNQSVTVEDMKKQMNYDFFMSAQNRRFNK